MSKKTRNIIITILLCVAGISLIGYGVYVSTTKEVDIVEQAKPEFEDTGEDYYGNTWRLEAYNNEDGKYVLLEVYMEEDHDMKWYGSVASGQAEINYIIYQNDHYVMSINPNLESGGSEVGFIFDKLEPNHSETATYLYYGLSIIVDESGTQYNVIGGELLDEVTDVPHDDHSDTSSTLELNPVDDIIEPESEPVNEDISDTPDEEIQED